MGVNDDLLQMIYTAMQAQRRSVRVYELMAAAAGDARDKEMLRTIRREERRHYYFLEGMYEDLTGEAAPPQKVAISMPKNFLDMLKTAICDKLEVIDHLEQVKVKTHCARHQELMMLIISDQKEHARILGAIYGRCS